MKHRVVFQVVSSLVLLAGIVAAILMGSKLIAREQAELRRTREKEALHIASGLETGIRSSIEPLEQLGSWWLSQGKPFDLDDWRSDGQLFLSRSAGLRVAAWVGIDGFQHWSAERGAQPNLKRIRPDDRLRQMIGAARAHESIAVSDIFETPDVRNAVYVCVPLRKEGRLRGYVIGLYDASALILSLADSLVRSDYRISVRSGEREIYPIPPGSRASREESSTAPVTIPNQVWTLDLHIPLSYFREFKGLILTFASVFGALLYASVTLLFLSQRRSSALERANAALEDEMTRRKRIEAEVRDLNRELNRKVADFQTLLDVIPIGIAVAGGAECRSIRLNPAMAEMLGAPPEIDISRTGEDAAPLPFRFIRNGQDLPPDELPFQRAAATGLRVFGEEDQIVRADGSMIDVLSFASPVFDEDGRVRGVFNASVDISHRKAAERLRRDLGQRLQRAQRMKSLGVMAAGIAHDFNNLLTIILGQASLAMESLDKPDVTRRHVAASMEAAQHAADLVRQVLAYTGRSYLTLRPIDLGEVIEEIRPSLLGLAGAKVEIRFHVGSPLPQVLAAPDEVGQVLKNLVQNALEATDPAGGVVEIGVDLCELSGNELETIAPDEKLDPGVYVRIEVKDAGPGMPAEIAERAFDPFFSTKFVGRGLGLSEVLGIMRAHTGAVRLETAPNSGTSVKLFFPVREYLSNHNASALPQSA
ncbi:MAG: PAS domain-containing protein [Acidobacteriia bacterium]|nr:PAS domain-containing protein [Terriglobia bacterium]